MIPVQNYRKFLMDGKQHLNLSLSTAQLSPISAIQDMRLWEQSFSCVSGTSRGVEIFPRVKGVRGNTDK